MPPPKIDLRDPEQLLRFVANSNPATFQQEFDRVAGANRAEVLALAGRMGNRYDPMCHWAATHPDWKIHSDIFRQINPDGHGAIELGSVGDAVKFCEVLKSDPRYNNFEFEAVGTKAALKPVPEGAQKNETRVCPVCKATSSLRKCSGCAAISYCSTACQRARWKHHNAECRVARVMQTEKKRESTV